MYLIKYPEIPPIGAMCSHVDQRRPLYFDRIYFRDTFANISFFKSRLKSHQKLANTWNRAIKTEAAKQWDWVWIVQQPKSKR